MLNRLQELATNNLDLIKHAGKGNCYHCHHVFNYNKDLETTDANTVICPNCGVDAVLPQTTPKLMKAMSKEYFSNVAD